MAKLVKTDDIHKSLERKPLHFTGDPADYQQQWADYEKETTETLMSGLPGGACWHPANRGARRFERITGQHLVAREGVLPSRLELKGRRGGKVTLRLGRDCKVCRTQAIVERWEEVSMGCGRMEFGRILQGFLGMSLINKCFLLPTWRRTTHES